MTRLRGKKEKEKEKEEGAFGTRRDEIKGEIHTLGWYSKVLYAGAHVAARSASRDKILRECFAHGRREEEGFCPSYWSVCQFTRVLFSP